ncbi:MAG: TlpA family protein disulfide reductase [Phycisphaerales bacterium]|nr:TlpA family protein disulfide reductase [Phycisphaerales bacterium]MCI0675007.1 TlpA family protein disulfide reductase [Phycisphaerales bacterium]
MTMKSIRFTLACLAAPLALAYLAFAGDEEQSQTIQLKHLASGITKIVRTNPPQELKLTQTAPADLAKAPENLRAPLYGTLPIRSADETSGDKPRGYLLLIDEPPGRPARMFVDSNRNADLTDDPPVTWEFKSSQDHRQDTIKHYQGSAAIDIGTSDEPLLVHLIMYRHVKAARGNSDDQLALHYYRDYGYQGAVNVGGTEYQAVLVDDKTVGNYRNDGARLLIDIDANGDFDAQRESFKTQSPFVVEKVAYEVTAMSPDGSAFQIITSNRKVKGARSGPDHSVGKSATSFQATTMEGNTVRFPSDYKGKIVLLDFWATWCPPCMKEAPSLVRTFEKHHADGFEILGISLDGPAIDLELKDTIKKKKMTWPQVYDGLKWKAEIAKLYRISSIPSAFLVDGDNGEILAIGDSLRGSELPKTVQKALEAKKAKASKSGPAK